GLVCELDLDMLCSQPPDQAAAPAAGPAAASTACRDRVRRRGGCPAIARGLRPGVRRAASAPDDPTARRERALTDAAQRRRRAWRPRYGRRDQRRPPLRCRARRRTGGGERLVGRGRGGQDTDQHGRSLAPLDQSTAQPRIDVGIVVAPGLARDVTAGIAENLLEDLRAHYDGMDWRSELTVDRLVVPPVPTTELLAAARRKLLAADWDLAVV